MAEARRRFVWMDLLWLAFLGGLAVLSSEDQVHKQLVLLAIGLYQIFEHRILGLIPSRGKAYSVIIKTGLASLLVAHSGDINSSYYLIYLLPVVTAAMFFGIWATLGWTALASAAYCSFLIPALEEYRLTASGATELAIRNLFFFFVAVLVNRFVSESRKQAAALAETNLQLERAQAEARRSERLAALGQLSAGLAHEIRNPLAVIKGSAETLSRKVTATDPLAVELAGFISSEVNRLNILVSRFLDFARPVKLNLHAEEIAPVVERALKTARDRWPDARVEVVRNYHRQIPPVPLDPNLAEQAFTNLVFNAYEALRMSGMLRVTIAPAGADGHHGVEVSFEDSGAGISQENCEAIFNPFFTTKEGGVGLGLSIVSKIMDSHGGWVRARSDPGKGACFRLFFPL